MDRLLNPNPRDGLFGMMIASLLNDRNYIPQDVINEDIKKAKNQQELKLQIISDAAFHGCTGLTSITCTGTKAQWETITTFGAWNSDTGNYTIHCTHCKI